jgi:hypothetical protein
MTARRPCPPAPGPLEDYATQFDADHRTQPEPSPNAQAAATAARGAQPTGHRGGTGRTPVVAAGTAGGAGLADPMDRVAELLAVVVASAPTAAAPSAA